MKESKIVIVIILTILLIGCSKTIKVENKINIEIKEEIKEEIIKKYNIEDIVIFQESFDLVFNELKSETDIINIKEIINNYNINNESIINNIYFGDTEGNFFIEPSIELPENYDFRERLPYKDAVSFGLCKPEPYIDYGSNNYIQSIYKPVYINDILVGVLGIDFNLYSEN